MPHEPGSVIHERYVVREVLGDGGFATTYRCDDTSSGAAVALKELHLHRVDDWKSVELFEREAGLLAALAHPGIPAFVDSFREEEDGKPRSFCLVQTLADGASLQQRLRAGELFDEARARDIAGQVLRILAYLHGLSPPVTHRDVKPANIVLDDAGRVQLVDFGAVRVSSGETGSTVAGTFGYMAPEQFQGRASPASDVYALAATLVHVLSGKAPETLPTRRLRIDFRAAVNVGDAFASWLDACLEPVAEDRPRSARDALALLDEPAHPGLPRPNSRGARPQPPARRATLAAALIGASALFAVGAGVAGFVLFSRAPSPAAVPAPQPIPPPPTPVPQAQPQRARPPAPAPIPNRVCTPLPTGKCRVRCSVDVVAGTTDCPPAVFSARRPLVNGQGVLAAHLAGRRGLELTAHICNPKGFTLHVADSPSCNGYGGDFGSSTWDAELQLAGSGVALFGSDAVHGAKLYADPAFLKATGCQDVKLFVGDGTVLAEEPCMTVSSDNALRLNPPNDREGKPDSDWYIGMNRVVGGGRTGLGLERLTLCVR